MAYLVGEVGNHDLTYVDDPNKEKICLSADYPILGVSIPWGVV
ncbi:MAG: hypothetical protein ACUVV0_17030 [Anaerolineae bacterium]